MKSAAKLLWVCLLVLGLSFMPLTSASSQTYTATVTGTVSDSQGAAVPGVKVVATNQGTKLRNTRRRQATRAFTRSVSADRRLAEPLLRGQQRRAGRLHLQRPFTGLVFADFLLDQFTSKGIGGVSGSNKGKWGHRQNRIGVFFQDDYKARNNLTLNLGMRWEYTSPVVEVADRQSNFDVVHGQATPCRKRRQ